MNVIRILRYHCFFLLLTLTGCASNEKWTSLLDENLHEHLDTYLGPPYDSVKGKFDSIPVGLNKDPLKVFSMIKENGEDVLRISGEHFGGVSTKKEFENYHLQLQFRWGQSKHHPKKKDKRDSGLLYHAGGRHGADYGFWMRSQELQIQEGDCGDYWGVAGGSAKVRAMSDSARFVYDAKGKWYTFNEKSAQGRRCIKNQDAEKPYGEWNTIELYCYGDTSVHVVNGKVVMTLFENAYLENDQLKPLKKGKLQIQSEGAEIFYRKLQITPIKALPKEITSDL